MICGHAVLAAVLVWFSAFDSGYIFGGDFSFRLYSFGRVSAVGLLVVLVSAVWLPMGSVVCLVSGRRTFLVNAASVLACNDRSFCSVCVCASSVSTLVSVITLLDSDGR